MAAEEADAFKLVYFGLPGRAEAIRLMLTIGDQEFEDLRLEFKDWPALKPTTPWGSLPILEVNGNTIAQTRAIGRYCARKFGLYPENFEDACNADTVHDVLEDISSAISAAGKGMQKEEKEAARLAVCSAGGKAFEIMQKLNDFVGKVGSDGYAVGNSFSNADINICVSFATLGSGFFDGVPTNLGESFPNLAGIHQKTFAHAKIAAYYNSKKEEYSAEGHPYCNWVTWQ